MRLDEVDTPALIVDLDALERNVKSMMDAVRATGVSVRPHAKTHKSADIAQLQIAHGAVGVCCQKVSEAEALVNGGVADVLVTNEIVGERKIERLASLARRARIGVCVDHPLQVEQLGAVCDAMDLARLDVYIEVDVGQGRCGVASPQGAIALARQIGEYTSLRFGGLQAYHGRAQHLREPLERQRTISNAQALVAKCSAALRESGVEVPVITGAGTGTYLLEARSGLWNEIQPGSYVFMDADYGRNKLDPHAERFEQSLHVLSTVISTSGERLVLDAGLKAYAVDSGLPHVDDAPGWHFSKASDEHGVLVPASAAPPLPIAIGSKLKLVPGHCDPTVNLHEWYVGIRHGVVETLWPISARGAMF